MLRTHINLQQVYTALLVVPFLGCASVQPEAADYYVEAPPASYQRGQRSGGHGAEGEPSPPGRAPILAEADLPLRVVLASQTDATRPPSERVLIYSAGLTVAVTDVQRCLERAQDLAEQADGYLQSMSKNSITIRVPAKSFEEVLGKLEALGQTLDKNINAQDVTDEYVDLELRLKNAEALRDRLLAILEKATTVEDMLKVETELNRIREEVERLKGRLADLDRRIAYSTIEVSFVEAAAPTARRRRPQTPFRWLDDLGVESVLQITRAE